MENQNVHYRHIMLFDLKKRQKMGLKRAISFVLCMERMRLQHVNAKKINFSIEIV